MKQIEIFNRSEIKFIIDREDSIDYLDSLEEKTKYDQHSNKETKSYAVYTIYFDTSDYKLMYMKIEDFLSTTYKWKLRLRWYEKSFDEAKEFFLEIKKKTGAELVKKIRIKLTKEEAFKLIQGEEINPVIKKKKYKKQFEKHINNLDLKPKILVKYNRIALVSDELSRITFDYDIKYNILNTGINGFVVDQNLCILELKTNGKIPDWLEYKFKTFDINKKKISKYKTTGKKIKPKFIKIGTELIQYEDNLEKTLMLDN